MGSYLIDRAAAQQCTSAQQINTQQVTPHNTAKNCIFILLAGAISHTDTFDFKFVHGNHSIELRSQHNKRGGVAGRSVTEDRRASG